MDDNTESDGVGDARSANQKQPIHKDTSKWTAYTGKKAWTKSKAAMLGARTVLNDISNKPVQKQSYMSLGSKHGDILSSSTSRAWNSTGKLVIGGRTVINKVSINDQLTNWASGQNVYN